jgi:glycosyltransferase involved in cell wall biosynthesis
MKRCDITIFMPSLYVGGAEMVVIRLLEGLIARGIKVELVLATKYGDLRKSIPESVNIIDLNCSRTIYSVWKLAIYLKKKKPAKLLSHLQRANRIAVLAKLISGTKTELYLVTHTTVSTAKKSSSFINKVLSYITYKILYKHATKLIHVSKGAARDLEKELRMKARSITVIYNPIVTQIMLNEMTDTPVPHPWFEDKNKPVIISAGGLRRVKGFDILIDAFYHLQMKLNSRLIILGDGILRNEIEFKISSLNLNNKVYLPGYVDNVFDYMKHASVFVLSSHREALPTVLVEALACGCSVVSTDCPNGPAEILENGKYGYLVPVNNPIELSNAIVKAINNPIPKNKCRNRAKEFTVDKSTDRYIEELNITNQ